MNPKSHSKRSQQSIASQPPGGRSPLPRGIEDPGLFIESWEFTRAARSSWFASPLPFAGFCLLSSSFLAHGNPEGMQVVTGSAQASRSGSQLTVSVGSQNAFLNWSSFNIGRGETTLFQQPSASSVVWNRINDINPSQILGNLRANGMVVLANQNGFYFGSEAFVKAAGLYITTAPINPSISEPGSFTFEGAPPAIPVVNYGRLETEKGGSLFVIAKEIDNHGSISAPGGTVGLVAGDSVMISDRPDGRGISVQVRLPAGSIDNHGQVSADAGHLLMQARTVNQSGIVHADSVREVGGVVEIFASERISLGAGSRISADGESQVPSAGGRITIKSDHVFTDEAGSVVSAAGGKLGGNGGQMELSATYMEAIHSALDASAAKGWSYGSLLLDPTDINLSSSGSGSAPGGVVHSGDGAGALNLNVNTAFAGFSSITLEATKSINLKVGTTWKLDDSTGKDLPGSLLTLRAGTDIKFEPGSSIQGGHNWSVSLTAGASFTGASEPVRGTGNVTLGGDSYIETGKGDIQVAAGNGVTVGQGAIRTIEGGSIRVTALAGSVNTGSNPNGYDFTLDAPGYVASQNLGGISTRSGGDVSITAGKDVSAFLPPANGIGVTSEAGTGAYGAEHGNVTIAAGGNVTGHYMLRNGEGSIHAGGNAGTASRQFALSLVKGRWAVDAGASISLQEVRNPNGIFNQPGTTTVPVNFHFDYDPAAAVSLAAANQILLTGTSLPRSAGGLGIPVIYPPSLSLSAGSGGVVLGSDVTLFPSPTGNLSVHTTAGGDFASSNPTLLRRLVLSDSDKRDWRESIDFTSSDAGNNVLHFNDTTPAIIDVAGSVSQVALQLAKPTQMSVAGDMKNSSLKAQNFHETDVTSLTVGGAIKYRAFYTFLDLPEGAPDPLLDYVLQYASLSSQLQSALSYNPTLHRIAFAGIMQSEERDALKSITVPDPYDPTGLNRLPAQIAPPALIDKLYHDSQDVPTVPLPGIAVSGPGKLQIRAGSMDLGMSDGVQSLGIAKSAQIPTTPKGAELDIDLAGDFDALSSSVTSRYGGDIHLTSGGRINVGSQELTSDSGVPRGIVSLWAGNIDVRAHGDIEVNGSRIATYDGGNIHLYSETGSVDAGKGGSGFVIVEKPYVDPGSGELVIAKATIPGSGVMTTSYPGDIPGAPTPQLGSIAVETPKGDIRAGAGGFVQIDLNGHANHDASVTLNAGTRNPDGSVLYKGSILANGSGVIGNKVDLKATGDITGLVVAQGNLNIRADQNVSVTAIGQGAVNVSSSAGSVSGTIVGVGAVSVSGSTINANVVAGPGQANVTGTVAGNGNQAGAAVVSTAGQTDSKKADEVVSSPAAAREVPGEAKPQKALLTKRRMSRVTVIFPTS
ncbi:MAG TPA: hypothetical protein DCM86_19615 [Verrucomicrobiales bacterium]|nr:hypothetical protein [Verrucomicrobiales bacterium]